MQATQINDNTPSTDGVPQLCLYCTRSASRAGNCVWCDSVRLEPTRNETGATATPLESPTRPPWSHAYSPEWRPWLFVLCTRLASSRTSHPILPTIQRMSRADLTSRISTDSLPPNHLSSFSRSGRPNAAPRPKERSLTFHEFEPMIVVFEKVTRDETERLRRALETAFTPVH